MCHRGSTLFPWTNVTTSKQSEMRHGCCPSLTCGAQFGSPHLFPKKTWLGCSGSNGRRSVAGKQASGARPDPTLSHTWICWTRFGAMAEKLLYTVDEAATLLSLSRTTLYELLNSGAIASVTVGRSRRITHRGLDGFVRGLERLHPAD